MSVVPDLNQFCFNLFDRVGISGFRLLEHPQTIKSSQVTIVFMSLKNSELCVSIFSLLKTYFIRILG